MVTSNPPTDPAARCAAAEQALLRHPGVERTAVLSQAESLLALVVPAEAYLDEAFDRTTAANAALRKWQKTYDLNQSSKLAVSAPSGFNTIGWDSSYTRSPLPSEDMREWVQTTVDSIRRLNPRSVYEIGCGSGLLLLRVAPQCDRYVAVDFSHEVIRRTREQLQSMPEVAARVELMERRADDFSGLEPQSFDHVVINSVIQYFPHSGYLSQVIGNAVRLVRDGGHIFIGDVRSLPLLPAFAASVELFQAQDELAVAEIRERALRRLHHTPELVLSPAWFLALRHRFDRIAHVEIALRRGRADNEMTRYRYDAILHVGPRREVSAVHYEPASADPKGQIRSRLQQTSEPFGIHSIPNARIERDRLALDQLRDPHAAGNAVGSRQAIGQRALRGVHPQDLFDLETEYPGLRVHLSWAASRSDGSYDALVIPAGAAPDTAFAAPEPSPSAQLRLANAPGQTGIRAQLMERLLAHCREQRPSSGIPDRVVLVDEIPTQLEAADCASLLAREDDGLVP
ncbi:MAG TPA: methyltransferase [Acidobacteriaceae bacterium]|nr:methyltransferase [Acidobacteriaceae bacterium]